MGENCGKNEKNEGLRKRRLYEFKVAELGGYNI
jgi:hypothetical protein